MCSEIRTYRFWLFLLYLLLLSITAHFFHGNVIAFVLMPFALFFYEISSYRFFLLYMAGYLLFFEAYMPTSGVAFIHTPDVCLGVFLILYLFFKRDYTFSIPLDKCLLPLYLFILYVFIMAVPVFNLRGIDGSLISDVKKFAILSTVVFFVQEPIFNPKKIYALLFAIVAYSSAYGLLQLVNYEFTHNRVVTWNEIYFGNALIIAVVMLTTIKNIKFKKVLIVLSVMLFVSLLITQTRSIWISTCLSLVLYMLVVLRSKFKKIQFVSVVKVAGSILVFFVVLQIIAQVALHTDIVSFLLKRLTQGEKNELVSPYASLGYRIYESYNVWLHRSFWGHGTGSFLYMFQTQMHMFKFVNWWSIHCEYMEILHKWGFFGLGLYLWFLTVYFITSFKLMLSKKKFISSLGAIAFFLFFNTAITSITSGYVFRANIILLDILLVGIVVNYSNRNNRMKKNHGAEVSDALPAPSSSTTDESSSTVSLGG